MALWKANQQDVDAGCPYCDRTFEVGEYYPGTGPTDRYGVLIEVMICHTDCWDEAHGDEYDDDCMACIDPERDIHTHREEDYDV